MAKIVETRPENFPLSSPVELVGSNMSRQTNAQAAYAPYRFDLTNAQHIPQYNSPNAGSVYRSNMGPFRVHPDVTTVIILRIFSFCDEQTLLDAALVSRRWLELSRRALFATYEIHSTSDLRLLRALIHSPGSTIRAEYVRKLDFSFTSEEAKASANVVQAGQRATAHVTANDIHQLLLELGSISSLRADWIGTRSSSTSPRSAMAVSPVNEVLAQPIPSFLNLPHISQGLKHLEVRGGSWPFESLLQTLAFMPTLVSLSMENIYESTSEIPLPPIPPACQLTRLSLGRCTLSGESTGWLLSSSQQTLRHLTINSVRRLSGSGSFNSALAIVGPALETLRIRNYFEFPRWEVDALVRAGLGYCPNLKTLVVWCDSPQSGAYRAPARSSMAGHQSPGRTNPSQSPSSSASLTLHTGSRPSSQHFSHSVSYGYPQTPTGTTSSRHAPGSPSDSYARPTIPSPEAMLPTLVNLLRGGWLPRLDRLVVPPHSIELCPNRVECQAELLIRGVTLGDNWGSS